MDDDLFAPVPEPKPKPKRVTAKQKRLAAPAPRQRPENTVIDPVVKALRNLDAHGMLSPEAKKEHADKLIPVSADTRAQLQEWRKKYGSAD